MESKGQPAGESAANGDGFALVGRVHRAHGRTGEVRVAAETDRPESTFAPGVVLRAGDPSGEGPDLFFPPLEVASVRPHGKLWLVRFEGMEDRARAELLHGRTLLRPLDEVDPLDEGEFFQHELVGLRVELADGDLIGSVEDVIQLEPSDLLEVRQGERLLLIPFTPSIVLSCEPDAGRIVIDPPEGLLEL